MFINIKYKNNSATLPQADINITDLAMLFGVKAAGMHLKLRHNNEWKNIWPAGDTGRFDLPTGIDDAILIASDEISSVNITPSSTTNITSNIWGQAVRGNNATTSLRNSCFYNMQPSSTLTCADSSSSTIGSRAIPSAKRATSSIPAPLKKKTKLDSCFKTISISDVSNNLPESIYDVPIDLNKLEKLNFNFGIVEIQKEIANQVKVPDQTFILTNKKGHPIRDMENTRGTNIFITHI